MAFRSFQDFVEQLDRAGELRRITEEVDTHLVIAEWANREMKSTSGGKALLFEKPIIDGKTSAFPVAINTLGSRKRIAIGLGVNEVADLAQEIQLILKAKPPTDLREGFALLKQGIHLLHARPKRVKEAACQEVVQILDSDQTSNNARPARTKPQISLLDLPILKCWPKDGGRFITFPNVHTRDPESGARNVGMYRMQIFDERTTAMHWQVHKVGARHGKVYYQQRERMPVEDYPVFHLTAITHRGDAFYPTTIVGPPPMEDFYMGDATVRIFLPVFKMNFPELVDMTLPPEGVFHNLVFVSIRKQYPYQAFKVMHGLWGMGQMMFSKYIVAVDEDCDVHNTSEVLFRLCANTDPARDTTVIKNPSDSLDHAPSEQNIGSHMGFDATRKLPGENYRRPWPELLKMTDEAKALVNALQAQAR